MLRFESIPTPRLEALADELATIYALEPDDMRTAQFARTLSVLARCEIARRHKADAGNFDNLPGFDK